MNNLTEEEKKARRKIWSKTSYERRKADIKAKYASGYYKDNLASMYNAIAYLKRSMQ